MYKRWIYIKKGLFTQVFESTLISVNELEVKRWKRGDIHASIVVQTSIFRRKKIYPFYLKFIAELDEFIPRLQNQKEKF